MVKSYKVYLNGEILEENQASVSVRDRGFLMGDGVYETFSVYGGVPYLLQRHLDRLRASAARLHIPVPESDSEITRYANELSRFNEPEGRSAGRITLTRGPGENHLRPSELDDPTLLVTVGRRKPPRPELYESGVPVTISSIRRMPRSSLDPVIKSTNLLNSLLARFEAQERGAFDALLLNIEGALAEGSFSNVFVITGEKDLITPSIAEGILGGITRDEVLAIGAELGYRVQETRIETEGLFRAREVFLTASVLEIMPVVSIDGRMIGSGTVGEGARVISRAYRERVERATGFEYSLQIGD